MSVPCQYSSNDISFITDFSLPAYSKSLLGTSPPPWRVAVRGKGNERKCQRHQREPANLRDDHHALHRSPAPFSLIASWLSGFYQECLENCSWVRMVFEAHGGVKCLILSCKLTPPANPVPAPHRQHGRPVNTRRQARERRQRDAWIKKREICSMPGSFGYAGDTTDKTTYLASASDTVVLNATLPIAPPSLRLLDRAPGWPLSPNILRNCRAEWRR